MCIPPEICYGASGILQLKINNGYITGAYGSATANTSTMATICNYFIDLDPGTYLLEFSVYNRTENNVFGSPQGNSRLEAIPKQSSVIVIPLE